MKKILSRLKPLIFMLLCCTAVITFTAVAFTKEEAKPQITERPVLNIWQIDNFEGGKGSRADYLKKTGEAFSKNESCYVTVTALTSEAARLNLEAGNLPDVVSYGAGMHGLEKYIEGYAEWCHGGYCFLTLDTNSDFSDINSQNTVINGGKDNFPAAAALLCDIVGAAAEKPTAAYVRLIDGKYKYLLGTQRDIYRLKTRAVSFAVKPVTVYNDLYQNVSVISQSKNRKLAERFVNYLIDAKSGLGKIGMLADGITLYEDEMKQMEGLSYEYRLASPVSADTRGEIQKLIADCNVNVLKNLLK